jgi:sugar phosphate isomerase/epimerase
MYPIGVNLGFAVNRYPEPHDWIPIVAEGIGVKRVQFVADLLNPSLPGRLRARKVAEINALCERYGIKIESAFTGAYTRVNHFGSEDPEIRNYWVKWFKEYIIQSADLGASSFGGHPGILSLSNDQNPQTREDLLKKVVEAWNELMQFASNLGYKSAAWEPMSISRELGHTLKDARSLQDMFNTVSEKIGICYDLDHGDLESLDSRDLDPLEWIGEFSSEIKMIHLKQTTLDRRKNMSFTKLNNEIGTVDGRTIISALSESNVSNCTLFLELGFRERNPDDQNVLIEMRESVDYWKLSGSTI